MSLSETLTQRNLERSVDNFDKLLSHEAKVIGKSIEGLPKAMRLVDYFFASAPTSTSDSQLMYGSMASVYGLEVGSSVTSKLGLENKVHASIDDTKFEHAVSLVHDGKALLQFYREKISAEGDKNLSVSMYSGNTQFIEDCHDPQEINKVGVTIYIDKENKQNFFETFLKKHQLDFNPKDYAVHSSQYHLTITPKRKFDTPRFSQFAEGVVNIANQVLTILEKDYKMSLPYLKAQR